MKYQAIIETNDIKDFKFFEDRKGQYIIGRDAGADTWMSIYFTEYKQFETVTEFADRCRECGAKYGKLFDQKTGHWNIPFLIHKELEIPIYEAQKAYEIAIDYLRSKAYVRG